MFRDYDVMNVCEGHHGANLLLLKLTWFRKRITLNTQLLRRQQEIIPQSFEENSW